jgi:pyridoxine 5-phosphate synthase
VARLDGVQEIQVGHAVIARAVLVGLRDAVAEMRSRVRA